MGLGTTKTSEFQVENLEPSTIYSVQMRATEYEIMQGIDLEQTGDSTGGLYP